jgi:hypothetical protein
LVANAQPDVNCPPVEVRQGASTLTVGPPPGAPSPMTVKYQGEITRMARECAVVAGSLTMRIGVQGRIVVGPAGGPGQVDVPLRLAIVLETPAGIRPIISKFIRIPVIVGPTDGNVVFSHIEDGLSFPIPVPRSLLDNYIAYVGFDPLSDQPPPQKHERKHKRKPASQLKLKNTTEPAVSAQ